jgi:hypothetical protein
MSEFRKSVRISFCVQGWKAAVSNGSVFSPFPCFACRQSEILPAKRYELLIWEDGQCSGYRLLL